jgi:hypothetical protein
MLIKKNNNKGERTMNNQIIEEKLRHELARKKINIEKKCEYNKETMAWTLKWYGEVYIGSCVKQVIDQLPLIKKYKKDISEVSGTDENDTFGLYSQMIVDNKLRSEIYLKERA